MTKMDLSPMWDDLWSGYRRPGWWHSTWYRVRGYTRELEMSRVWSDKGRLCSIRWNNRRKNRERENHREKNAQSNNTRTDSKNRECSFEYSWTVYDLSLARWDWYISTIILDRKTWWQAHHIPHQTHRKVTMSSSSQRSAGMRYAHYSWCIWTFRFTRYSESQGIYRHRHRTCSYLQYARSTSGKSSEKKSLLLCLDRKRTLLYRRAARSHRSRPPYPCDSRELRGIRELKGGCRYDRSNSWYWVVSLWISCYGQRGKIKTWKKRISESI